MSTDSEIYLRLTIFFSICFIMAFWEFLRPKRRLSFTRIQRWPANLSIILVGSVLVRLILPISLTAIAIVFQKYHFGLFNFIELPNWSVLILSILILDLAVYGQHYFSHRWQWFWRLHRMHHADQDFDFTTGNRFHPVEILVSSIYKIFIIGLFGIPATVVLIFEIILNASSVFNHGNVYFPEKLDRILRKVLVTPDMHRVHHSTELDEMHRNFGFTLSVWDFIFSTYNAQPKKGHLEMNIGLSEQSDIKKTGNLFWMLTYPFKKNS
ncbi:MAG: sterol desaturase family protein [Oligoflexales bacterium]|nr:sterol desaturase family protein [Oligoflexales bacterium]